MTTYKFIFPHESLLTNCDNLSFKSYENKYLIKQISNSSAFNLYRSVIFSKSKQLLSFFPPKNIKPINMIDYDYPINAEELIDGTMINLYWDPFIDDWDITTKHSIGAYNIPPYNTKNFRTMFLECLSNKFDISKIPEVSQNGLPLLFCFIIQHKEHRIVTRINEHDIYLLHIYEIDNYTSSNYSMVRSIQLNAKYNACSNNTWAQLMQEVDILFPKKIIDNKLCKKSTITEFIHLYSSNSAPYNMKGIVLNQNTAMFKVENPLFKHVKQLRGNYNNKLHQYLHLKQDKKVIEYLNYYHEDSHIFKNYKTLYESFIYKLQNNYVKCYILHKYPLKKTPKIFRGLLFELHKLYKKNKTKITFKFIKHYFKSLHPTKQLYYLTKV